MTAVLAFARSLGSGYRLISRTGTRIAFNAMSGFLLGSPQKRVRDVSAATLVLIMMLTV